MSSVFNPTEMNKAVCDVQNISEIIKNVPLLLAKIASLEEQVNSNEFKNAKVSADTIARLETTLNESAKRSASLEADLAKERAINAGLLNKIASISGIIAGVAQTPVAAPAPAPAADAPSSAPSTPKVERKAPTPKASPKRGKALWGDEPEDEPPKAVAIVPQKAAAPSFAAAAATAPATSNDEDDCEGFTKVNHQKKPPTQQYKAPRTFICMNLLNHGFCANYNAENPWDSACEYVHNAKEMGKLANPCRHTDCNHHVTARQMCMFDHTFDHQMTSANYLIEKVKPAMIRGYTMTYRTENDQE